MDKIYLTQAEFDALDVYSKSLPTNLYYGREWKRLTQGGWVHGKVVLRGRVGIQWREIVIKENASG